MTAIQEVLPKANSSAALPGLVEEDSELSNELELGNARTVPTVRRKSNNYAAVPSLSARCYIDGIRAILSGGTEDVTKSGRMIPSSCSICLEEYDVGEKIGWSKNDKCLHAFHKDCIVEWLMKRDDCPICRNKYFKTQD